MIELCVTGEIKEIEQFHERMEQFFEIVSESKMYEKKQNSTCYYQIFSIVGFGQNIVKNLEISLDLLVWIIGKIPVESDESDEVFKIHSSLYKLYNARRNSDE